MVTTHFGLVSGIFWAPSGPIRAHFGPKCPLLGPIGPKIGPQFKIVANLLCDHSKSATNCFRLVWLGWNHGYHNLWPCIGPSWALRAPKRACFGPERPFWGPQRDLEGQIWSQLPRIGLTGLESWLPHFGLVSSLSLAPRDTKRARFWP